MLDAPLSVWFSAAALTAAAGLLIFAVAGRQGSRTAKQILADAQPGSLRDLTLRSSALERATDGIVELFRNLGRRLTPAGVASEMDARIARAGMSSSWTADRLIAVKGMGSLAVFLVLFLVALAASAPLVILFAAGLAVFAFFIPDLIIVRRGVSRDEIIRNDLADVVDQILITVEAGASLDTAIDRVTRNSDGPLQAEFRRMLQDVGFGLSRKDALTAMMGRTSVPELRELLLAIAQSEEHGLSIGTILRVQTAEIRDKRRTRAEEAAMKVPVKIVFPLILCILPCLLAIIAGPAIIRISQNLNLG